MTATETQKPPRKHRRPGPLARFLRRLLSALLLCAVAAAAFLLGSRFASDKVKDVRYLDGTVLSSEQVTEVIGEEQVTVTILNLQQIVAPASDLVVTRYYYTNANAYESAKSLWDITLPLTTNRIVYKYDGCVGLGFDIQDIAFQVDNENRIVTVTLPEIAVLFNKVEPDSFQYYDVKRAVFNRMEVDEITDMIAELERIAADKALSNQELMAQARDNAQKVIAGFLEGSDLLQDYELRFQ